MNERPCIILNPKAGALVGQSTEWVERLRRDAEVIEVADPQELSEIARSAAQQHRRLIAAGGDGTIHTVLNALAADFERNELAILPVGTGNDLARALGIPLDDLDAALELALRGPARPADVIAAHNAVAPVEHFINMCYGGFGARIADQVEPEEKSQFGLWPNWLRMARQMVEMPEHEVEIQTGGTSTKLSLHGLLLANSCYLGGGLPAAPHARLNDGLLDVHLVPTQSLWDRVVASVDLLSGRLSESDRTLTFATRELTIHAAPEMEYTMDGEAAPRGPFVFRVVPGALRIVAGEQALAFSPPQGT